MRITTPLTITSGMQSTPIKVNLGLELATNAYKSRIAQYMFYRVKAVSMKFRPYCTSFGQTSATASGTSDEQVTVVRPLAVLFTRNSTESFQHSELFQHPRTHIMTCNRGKTIYFKVRRNVGGLSMGEATDVNLSLRRSPWVETQDIDCDWGVFHMGTGID